MGQGTYKHLRQRVHLEFGVLAPLVLFRLVNRQAEADDMGV